MNGWKLLLSLENIYDAYTVRSLLELANIDVQIKDELTVQVAPIYSSAIGGIRIYVREIDFERALQLVLDHGYENNSEITTNKFLEYFNEKTKSLPLIGSKSLLLRLLSVVTIFALIIIIPLAIYSYPKQENPLTSVDWCISEIRFNGEELKLDSTKKIITWNNCLQRLSFYNNGGILMPEYENSLRPSNWYGNEEYLTIECNTTDFDSEKVKVLEGDYDINISDNLLEMKSEKVTIKAIAQKPIY